MFPWGEYISGTATRAYFIENPDYPIYMALGYLAMVHYGPSLAVWILGKNPEPQRVEGKKGLVHAPDPAWLRTTMIVWNIGLSIFSLFCAMVLVPPVLTTLYQHGWHDTVCRNRPHFNYTGVVGSWTTIFALSKMPELVDSLLLVIQKKKTPPFLHWYHHLTVLIFCWLGQAVGNSSIVLFAAMNATVHTVMYAYFALCAAGMKTVVRPLAPFITIIQILQMVVGCAASFYTYSVNHRAYMKGENDIETLPCAVGKSAGRFAFVIYLSYLYLFSRMFVHSYVRRPTPRVEANGVNGHAAEKMK